MLIQFFYLYIKVKKGVQKNIRYDLKRSAITCTFIFYVDQYFQTILTIFGFCIDICNLRFIQFSFGLCLITFLIFNRKA